MINTFLQDLAARVMNENMSFKEVLIVLPSKRACYILERELASKSVETVFAPTLLAIEDFITCLADKKKGEMLPMVYQLYLLLQESLLQTDLDSSFEKFLSLGQMLLQDFSDIREHVPREQYKEVFTYLTEYKKMALWNIDILTDFEKKYIHSWNQMENIFLKQSVWMDENDMYDKGSLVQIALQNADSSSYLKPFDKIYIAGFNAINYKEGNIFLALQKWKSVEYVWDIDRHYFDNKTNEAGDFLRKNKSIFPMDETRFSDFFKSSKKVEITGTTGGVQQIELTKAILKKLQQEQKLSSTLIVLNDEMLLSPLLHSLDKELIEMAGGLNVTMGWRLQNNYLYQLIFRFLKLHVQSSQPSQRDKYYYKDIYAILHSYPDFVESYNIEKLNSLMTQDATIYYTLKELKEMFLHEKMVVKDVFYQCIDWNVSPVHFLKIILSFLKNLKIHSEATSIDLAGYDILYDEIRKLKLFFETNELNISYHLLQWIFEKQIAKTSIPLDGEATKGLQIMGMLETRNLDFENVIMLNVNEGVLPSGKLPKSTIPFEARALYGIPDHYQQDAVFAYHFIRILQRANSIYLMYNALKDEKQAGECSRFITQLEHELPPSCQISHHFFTLPIEVAKKMKIDIVKTKDIMDNIKNHFRYVNENHFISFTAMNELYMCPLKYYWNRVLKIRKPILPFESTDASSFGSIVHKVLEDIFTPLLNKEIEFENLKISDDQIRSMVEQRFHEMIPQSELLTGKNVLLLEKAVLQILNVLKCDQQILETANRQNIDFKILRLEAEFKLDLILNDGEKCKIGGLADRIQQKNDLIEICDYKTGRLDKSKIQINSMSDLDNSDKRYARQLLHYLILLNESKEYDFVRCSAGIFFLNSYKEGLHLLEIKPDKNEESFDENEVMNEYKRKCIAKIEDFLNPDLKILQTHDIKECNFCDFKNICY